jgi:hypothetical protein
MLKSISKQGTKVISNYGILDATEKLYVSNELLSLCIILSLKHTIQFLIFSYAIDMWVQGYKLDECPILKPP